MYNKFTRLVRSFGALPRNKIFHFQKSCRDFLHAKEAEVSVGAAAGAEAGS